MLGIFNINVYDLFTSRVKGKFVIREILIYLTIVLIYAEKPES